MPPTLSTGAQGRPSSVAQVPPCYIREVLARKKRKSDQDFQVRVEEMGVPDAGKRLRRAFDLILMAVTRAELSSAGSKEDDNGQIVNGDH